MTKLEEKLEELGYELTSIDYSSGKPYMIIYEKQLNNTSHIELHYIIHKKSWVIYFYIDTNGITPSYEFMKMTDTFNIMQKDLEILKGVEDDK